MEKLKLFLVDCIIIMFIFITVCIAMLVDIKSFESPKESVAIKEVNSCIEKEKKDIEAMSQLLINEQKQLENMKTNMEALKKENKIDEWNNSVVDYNKKYGDYEKKFEEYNKKTEEYDKKYNQRKMLANKDEDLFQWIKSLIGIE